MLIKEILCIQNVEKLIDVDNDVQIELYTLNNSNEPQLLAINDTTSIEKSNYNLSIPTRIFVHGFLSNGGLTKVLIDGIVFCTYLFHYSIV